MKSRASIREHKSFMAANGRSIRKPLAKTARTQYFINRITETGLQWSETNSLVKGGMKASVTAASPHTGIGGEILPAPVYKAIYIYIYILILFGLRYTLLVGTIAIRMGFKSGWRNKYHCSRPQHKSQIWSPFSDRRIKFSKLRTWFACNIEFWLTSKMSVHVLSASELLVAS